MRMHRFLKFVLIAIVALILPLAQLSCSQSSQEPTLSQQNTLYSKPAVVRVVAGCVGGYFYEDSPHFYSYGGQGTGFFISPDGYIATRGTLKDSDCKDRLFKRFSDDLAAQGISIANTKLTKEGVQGFLFFHSVILPSKDGNSSSETTPFEIKVSSSAEDKDISIIKIATDGTAPALKIADPSVDTGKVRIQDEVLAIGYPANADLNKVDKPSKDDIFGNVKTAAEQFVGNTSSFEASAIEGKVSNPDKKLPDDSPILQLDMRAGGYGIAGSPVLNSHGEVVGMLASGEVDKKVVDFLDSDDLEEFAKLKDGQNTIPNAIPANTIQEFIQDSGTVNKQALLDQYYREGLKLYWQGNYTEAKVKFQGVKGLFSQHSEVDRLIRECDKYQVKEFFQPNMIIWGAIAAVAALMLGLIFFLMRRKPSAAPKPSAEVRPFGRHSPTGSAKSNNSKAQTWLELEGVGETRKLPLYKDTHRIGRDPAWSDIEMPASWEVLSRHHAIFKREGDSYRVFDGDGKVPSRNGLLVDDYDKVDSIVGHLLRPGDTLAIGSDPREQVRITYFNSTAGQAKDETKVAT
jgi:S1-C subfamily serine protease